MAAAAAGRQGFASAAMLRRRAEAAAAKVMAAALRRAWENHYRGEWLRRVHELSQRQRAAGEQRRKKRGCGGVGDLDHEWARSRDWPDATRSGRLVPRFRTAASR